MPINSSCPLLPHRLGLAIHSPTTLPARFCSSESSLANSLVPGLPAYLSAVSSRTYLLLVFRLHIRGNNNHPLTPPISIFTPLPTPSPLTFIPSPATRAAPPRIPLRHSDPDGNSHIPCLAATPATPSRTLTPILFLFYLASQRFAS